MSAALLVGEVASSPLLDPPTRAVLLMSLLAFVVLGLGLVGGVMLGGRWVRRMGSDDLRKPLPLRRPAAGKPEREPAMLRGVHWEKSSDTAAAHDATSETVAR